jgi:cytoskeleton protein RodZ
MAAAMSDAVESRAAAGGSSAGGRLRAAREAAGLSIDAVAQQLKLAPRQVRALEEDDWQRLPGRTFVRGFARNYARFVRLDPEAVLALLPAPEAAPALERPALRTSTRPMGEIPAEREAKSSARWLLPLFIVALVGAAGYYELSRSSPHLPAWLTSRVAAPAPDAHAPAPATQATTTLPNPVAPSSPTAATTDAASPTPPNSGALALAPKVLDSDGATPATGTTTPGGAAPATGSAVPTTATPGMPGAATNDAPLVLVFRGTSWAEVKDANGRVVLQMTGGAGMTQTVNATPPLELALGNAPAVGVTFRGQPLDLAPYTRGNVARVGLK